MTASRKGSLSAADTVGMPASSREEADRERTSEMSCSWKGMLHGRDRAHMRNMAVSLVVSIPARRWSASSDAMSRSSRPPWGLIDEWFW